MNVTRTLCATWIQQWLCLVLWHPHGGFSPLKHGPPNSRSAGCAPSVPHRSLFTLRRCREEIPAGQELSGSTIYNNSQEPAAQKWPPPPTHFGFSSSSSGNNALIPISVPRASSTMLSSGHCEERREGERGGGGVFSRWARSEGRMGIETNRETSIMARHHKGSFLECITL